MPRIKESKPTWAEKEIAILTVSGTTVKVRAVCCEEFGIHPAIGKKDNGKYAVSQLSTGLTVLLLGSEQDCKKFVLCVYRFDKVRQAFKARTVGLTKQFLPSWVSTWCVACRDQCKVLEPDQFFKLKETE
jgi:hypothetical protein